MHRNTTNRITIELDLSRKISIPTTEELHVNPTATVEVTEEESKDPELMSAMEKWHLQSLQDMAEVLSKHESKIQPANNLPSEALSRFVIDRSLSSNSKKAEELKIDLPADLRINDKIINIPVLLDDKLCDWGVLTKLPEDKNGYRTNPSNGKKFALCDLKPALAIQQRYDQIFNDATQKVSENSYRPFRK